MLMILQKFTPKRVHILVTILVAKSNYQNEKDYLKLRRVHQKFHSLHRHHLRRPRRRRRLLPHHRTPQSIITTYQRSLIWI